MQLKFTAAASMLSKLLFIAFMLVSPMIGISQGAFTPTTEGGAPLGESTTVPFEDKMDLLFLVAGLTFVAIVTVTEWWKKQLNRKLLAELMQPSDRFNIKIVKKVN